MVIEKYLQTVRNVPNTYLYTKDRAELEVSCLEEDSPYASPIDRIYTISCIVEDYRSLEKYLISDESLTPEVKNDLGCRIKINLPQTSFEQGAKSKSRGLEAIEGLPKYVDIVFKCSLRMRGNPTPDMTGPEVVDNMASNLFLEYVEIRQRWKCLYKVPRSMLLPMRLRFIP